MINLINKEATINALRKQDLEFMQQADLQVCIRDTINKIPTVNESALDEDEIFNKIQTTNFAGVKLSYGEECLIKLAVKICKEILFE